MSATNPRPTLSPLDDQGCSYETHVRFTHMRLRARDYYTSSTLIGGKGGAGASLPHNYA